MFALYRYLIISYQLKVCINISEGKRIVYLCIYLTDKILYFEKMYFQNIVDKTYPELLQNLFRKYIFCKNYCNGFLHFLYFLRYWTCIVLRYAPMSFFDARPRTTDSISNILIITPIGYKMSMQFVWGNKWKKM